MELWNDYYRTVLKPPMQNSASVRLVKHVRFQSIASKEFPRLTPAKFHYPGNQELLNAVRPGYENVSKLIDISF